MTYVVKLYGEEQNRFLSDDRGTSIEGKAGALKFEQQEDATRLAGSLYLQGKIGHWELKELNAP